MFWMLGYKDPPPERYEVVTKGDGPEAIVIVAIVLAIAAVIAVVVLVHAWLRNKQEERRHAEVMARQQGAS